MKGWALEALDDEWKPLLVEVGHEILTMIGEKVASREDMPLEQKVLLICELHSQSLGIFYKWCFDRNVRALAERGSGPPAQTRKDWTAWIRSMSRQILEYSLKYSEIEEFQGGEN